MMFEVSLGTPATTLEWVFGDSVCDSGTDDQQVGRPIEISLLGIRPEWVPGAEGN
jgi:hypothetical protein